MVVNIQPQEEELKPVSFFTKINRWVMNLSSVPSVEILFFVQHLAVMLKAGVSLVVALKTLAKQTANAHFAEVIGDVSKSVEKGVSFTDALRPHEKIFGELFINMIEAGEVSGKLENVLQQLYLQTKKNHRLVAKVKGALIYPTVIIFAMVGIGTFMMIFVVPKITVMLKEFNSELPLPTRVLMWVSDTLVQNGPLVLVILAVLGFTIKKILATYRGKFLFHKLLLGLPSFGNVIKKINLARFSRTVSALLKTDIMIIKTFQITASTLGNLHYREALLEVSEKIKKGSTINETLAAYPHLFPPLVIEMIAIGEQTGEVDNILAELAEYYEEEVDQIMDSLPALIEPVLILVLGLGVAGVALAIIMPMYSLTDAV